MFADPGWQAVNGRPGAVKPGLAFLRPAVTGEKALTQKQHPFQGDIWKEYRKSVNFATGNEKQKEGNAIVPFFFSLVVCKYGQGIPGRADDAVFG